MRVTKKIVSHTNSKFIVASMTLLILLFFTTLFLLPNYYNVVAFKPTQSTEQTAPQNMTQSQSTITPQPTTNKEPLWLGVDGADMNEDIATKLNTNQSTGILVVGVIADTPADKAGMKGGFKITVINGTEIQLGGDIITSADKIPIQNLKNLSTYITNNKREGDKISLGILRDGKHHEIDVALQARPMNLKQ